MSNIEIKKVASTKDLKTFVNFPFQLFKESPYWTPPLISDELNSFNPDNEIFKSVDYTCYLAFQNNKVVGRVAAMINWTEVKELQKTKVRFGWFDFIEDMDVAKALLNKVRDFGLKNGVTYMEGPMGFSNMDKAGILTFGFEEPATMIGLYNPPYYVDFLTNLGFEEQAKWLEYKLNLDNISLSNINEIAAKIEHRYKVKSINFNSTNDILPYADELFGILNRSYAVLQSFVPIQDFQIQHYKEKYIKFLNPDFVKAVADENGKLIAFAVTMPSLSKGFKKANGKLLPFGFWHLLQAKKNSKHIEFYLIGIDPEYQNKGITALLFRDLYNVFKKYGVKTLETNPQLEENKRITQLWKNFDPELHKKRCTFRRDLALEF